MSETWSRVISINEGTVMVVSDLHGDWDAYCRYRDRFLTDYEAGNAQYLVFLGDLIHRDSPPEIDRSLDIVLDVMKLREAWPEAVIYLCGNHELAHIYHQSLARNGYLYTARFEAQLGDQRDSILTFFRALPFYVRTAAGICLAHAGATATFENEASIELVFNLSHNLIFDRVNRALAGKNLERLRDQMIDPGMGTYADQVKDLLAVTEPDDPRYDDLLRGHIANNDFAFRALHQALSTRCEYEYGTRIYKRYLSHFLKALSALYLPQRFCVAGHIDVSQGSKTIGRHLRIASGKHALNPKAACYLMFDAAKPVRWRRKLLNQLQPSPSLL